MEQRNKRNQGKAKPVQNNKYSNSKPEQIKPLATPLKPSNGHVLIDMLQKWQVLIVFVFGVLLYVNTLGFDYTLDDMLMIYKNKFTTEGVHGIHKIMTTDAFTGFFGENKNLLTGGRYRPLSQVMFAIEWQFFGNNPFVGHLMNILMYGLLGVLILQLLKKMFPAENTGKWYFSLPFIATMLYMAHPIHTEVVANVKGRDELITSIFSLLTVYFAFLYVEKNKIYYLGALFAVYLLALFSKENALTFFAIVPLTVYFFKEKNLSKIGLVIAPMIMALVVYFGIRFQLGLMNFSTKETELLNDPYLNATSSERYATVFYTLWKYIQLLIVPINLTHDYYPKQIPIINWTDLRAIGSLLVYVGIGIAGLWGLMKRNIWGWLAVFYLATLSISSNLFFNIGAFMNERFVFTSSLAFAVLVAYLINRYLRNNEKIVTFTLLLLLSLYSVKTFSRNYAWKDDFTLFTTDVLTSTNSAKVNTSAGGTLIEKAQKEENLMKKNEMLEQAKIYLDKATKIHPYYVAGWVLYGNSFLYLEQYPQAVQCYANSLNIAPGYADARTNLLYAAQTTFTKKLYDQSAMAYKVLVKQEPKNLDFRTDYAAVMEELGRWDTSMVILNAVIKEKPDFYKAYNKLGQIYGKRLNQLDVSISYIEKATKLNPKDVSSWENLGVAYGIKGRYKESITALLNAIAIDPKDFQAYFNLSSSYRLIGDVANANKCAEKGTLLKAASEKKK